MDSKAKGNAVRLSGQWVSLTEAFAWVKTRDADFAKSVRGEWLQSVWPDGDKPDTYLYLEGDLKEARENFSMR